MLTEERRLKRNAYMRTWRAEHAEIVRERDREYGRTEAGRIARNAAMATWRERNAEKRHAHTAVSNALRDGRIVRGPCFACGTRENVQGHHANGYTDGHELDVHWLCRPHHQFAHGRGPLMDDLRAIHGDW